MHRTGSSMVTNMLQRLGMSLGPFDLLGATEHNPHGYFEAVPVVQLGQELQQRVLGFPDDYPASEEVLHRFCQSEGRWSSSDVPALDDLLQRGTEVVRQLVESGPISGFKDPRFPLVWPFWTRVFSAFPGLRVVPLIVLRSPHEIAMSIFTRSKGRFAYPDALDVTAVHFKRLIEIQENWPGASALVRNDVQVLGEDLRRAAGTCGLPWSDEICAAVYDRSCKHYEAAVVTHPVEALFQRLAHSAAGLQFQNLSRIERDTAAREKLLQAQVVQLHQAVEQAHQEIALCRQENALFSQEIARQTGDIQQHQQALASRQSEVEQCRQEIARQVVEIQQHQQELAGRQGELEQCRQEIARQTVEIQQHQQELAGRQGELEQCRQEIARQTGEIQHHQQEIARQTGEIQHHQQEIARQTGEIEQQRQELASRQGELEQCRQEITRQTVEIQQHQQDLTQCRQEIARQAGEIEQQRQELAGRQIEVVQCREAIVHEQEAGEESRREIQRLLLHIKQDAQQHRQQCEEDRQQREQLARELEQLRQEGAKWRGRAAELQRELALITGSRTWRLRHRIMTVVRPQAEAETNGSTCANGRS
jgi:chromosome segregation ATPase